VALHDDIEYMLAFPEIIELAPLSTWQHFLIGVRNVAPFQITAFLKILFKTFYFLFNILLL